MSAPAIELPAIELRDVRKSFGATEIIRGVIRGNAVVQEAYLGTIAA